ncbi:DUF2255 family protein [Streptomyces stackebrandtii]|uniref:DUF2255 family protein n=1 Tax=Streptomyces stackebrandtii TaxID=3051177 RepID=UPI0028DD2BB1|nr:DUF2255 family protein [Streptomyces sp. DSM 40976]
MEPAVHLGHQTQVTLYVEGTGEQTRTFELWIVRVDDHAYLRALSGIDSWWYQQVTMTTAQLWCAEGIVRARFEPVEETALLDRIDTAYEDKYGLGWPGPVGFITAPEARGATLRVVREHKA